MLGQRRRRWANVGPTLFQRVVFAGGGVFGDRLGLEMAHKGSMTPLWKMAAHLTLL